MYRKEIEGFTDSHRGEMIEDIYILCRINSEKIPYVEGKSYREGPSRALQAALSMAEGYGFTIRSYDNYVGIADPNDKERQLDIPAHLDMVPTDEGQAKTEPLEPVVKDGKLFDRGIADDRRPTVTTLYAMRVMKELDTPLNRNVRLILGTSGECRSSDIVNYYDKEDGAPMTFSPDAELPVINIEKDRLEGHFHAPFQTSEAMPRLMEAEARIKTNMVLGKARAVVEGVGLKTLEVVAEAVEKETGVSFVLEGDPPVMTVTAQGEGAYASTPQEGKDALTGLLVYLTRLPLAECPQMNMIKSPLKLFPRGDICGKVTGIDVEDQLSGNLTLTFSTLTAGANGLEGVFDSRCPTYVIEESVLRVIKQAMADHGFILENDFMMPPHHVDGNSHFVKTLLSVYKDYIDLERSCQVTGGGTYVHSLKNDVAHGVVLPETDNRIHGTDEFMVVNELVLSAKIFAQVIMELCS